MDLHFHPQCEAELKRAAAERGRAAEQFVQEIVEAYLGSRQVVQNRSAKGLAQLDKGESLSHDEMVASIERMSSSDGNRGSSRQKDLTAACRSLLAKALPFI